MYYVINKDAAICTWMPKIEIHLFACILVDKTIYVQLNIWLQQLELARKRSCQANFTQEISHQDKTTDQHCLSSDLPALLNENITDSNV